MGVTSFLVLFLLSHLMLLHSGQGKNQSFHGCPVSFQCGSLGLMGFPFTHLNQPDCGLCMVDCDKKPFPNIQLEKNGTWYEARTMLQNDTILVFDPWRDYLLKSQSCDSFNNISLPNSPSISFTFSFNFTFFKCTKGLLANQYFDSNYNVNHDCPDFSIYYTNYTSYDEDPPSIPSNLPPSCSVLLLPLESFQVYSFNSLLSQLSAQFSLQLHVSNNCSKCNLEGRLCRVDSKNEFCCDKGHGKTHLKSILVADRQLGWEKLYQIAVGAARGLEYLHRGCNTRILHFDIKPHNILLDEDFCPKISDFGLAKLCPRKESIVSMLIARGTIGYIAPEIVCRNIGGVSHKSDVYSYGMMVLEMVGGRKNVEVVVDKTSEIYFPHWIYQQLEQDGELGLCSIMNDEENMTAKKMKIVSLWCIQTEPSSRPAMNRVLEMLEGSLDSLQIPPKPVLSSPPRPTTDFSTTESTPYSESAM